MNIKSFFTSSFFLRIVFAASLLILIFISITTYKHTLDLSKSIDRMVDSHNVRNELERLMSTIKDAETGQRGFIITKDSTFLEPYNGAKLKSDRSFSRLMTLMVNNKQQKEALDSLHFLISLRFRLLKSTMTLASQTGTNKAMILDNMLLGKKVMDDIRKQVSKMIAISMLDSRNQQNEYKNEISFSPMFTLLLLLFSVLIFIMAYYRISKDIEYLKLNNEKLLIKTESIKHAEQIGEFSTWQWDLEKNILEYSDNQYNLLGVEPQSFEPTIENFLAFVHPDDRHIITEGGNNVLNNDMYPPAFFRVIRKDGAICYYKSLSKLLVDKNGKKMLIGINRDITVKHLNHLALKERNLELEQSNRELASFNHIASHDLQEPLRKIQLFISRIADKEKANLSPSGKEYFEKIQSSAKRMRILIDDLLMFSRTNKAEKIVEETDLNLLLENAMQELAQMVEETQATIESTPLPTLNVIPFQIQQLFINLISNSLKYRKADVDPLIKITSTKIAAKDLLLFNSATTKKYHAISITDNGLGFEQQYAENIFKLFHRLHTQSDYSGTGIGLAICKKIMENHDGFITAIGKPTVGSTFTFYLPA